MLWIMVACCALPLILLLLGGSAVFSGGYLKYVIIGALALICISMMFKRHRRRGKAGEDEVSGTESRLKTKDTSAENDSCH